jgi:hypothetical protein
MTSVHSRLLVSLRLLLLLAAPPALAARGLPAPVLQNLEAGYGVVLGEVMGATPAARDDSFTVRVRAVEVLARPAAADAFALNAGDAFVVVLHVGYASEIEQWDTAATRAIRGGGAGGDAADRVDAPGGPLAAGARLILTVRRAGADYEHARGADAVVRVRKEDDVDRRVYARLQQLAALPWEQRLAEALRAACTLTEPAAVRKDLIYWFRDALLNRPPAEHRRVVAALTAHFRDAHGQLPQDEFTVLDFTLRSMGGDEFERSIDRERAWIARLLAPFPKEPQARAAETRRRDEVMPGVVPTLLANRPDEVGAVLLKEMDDPKWPLQFRWRLAAILHSAYERHGLGGPAWRDGLLAWYPRALDVADSGETRLILTGLVGAGGEPRGWRVGVTPEMRAALGRSLTRMRKVAEAGDLNGQVAVQDLSRTIERVDTAAREGTPAGK